MHDVYAYGVIAHSTLVELSDEFPSAGGYAEIAGIYPSIGGEAAGSAYALARLGVQTKLNGNHLRNDEPSARVLETLSSAGVDCRAVGLYTDVPSVSEVILATGEHRTVLGTYRELIAASTWNDPAWEDIDQSRLVCLDPFFGDASRQAARWCVETETPYVTVDTPPESEIARSAEVLVISEEFAGRTFSSSDPREVLASYTEQSRGLVILTRGGERILYGRRGNDPLACEPFSVEVRDTTGAGDSFRAGIIYGMLRGCGDADMVRTASAVAAVVCRRVPGVVNSPTEPELEAFLAENL